MAIPISGTMKPAGDFPIAEAEDIVMPDGKRLPETLKNVSGVAVSDTPPENKNALWIDLSDNGRDNTTHLAEVLGQIDALLGGGE